MFTSGDDGGVVLDDIQLDGCVVILHMLLFRRLFRCMCVGVWVCPPGVADAGGLNTSVDFVRGLCVRVGNDDDDGEEHT